MSALFFGVDDTAELRALASADVPEPDQVPVECVRAALALGATRVEVRFRRSGFRLTSSGAALPEAPRAALQLALTTTAAVGERARALEALGAGPAAPLAVLLHPAVRATSWRPTPLDLDVEVRGLASASARARLRAACRYAPHATIVDGVLRREGAVAIGAGSARRALPGTERGVLTLLPESEAPRAILLTHGVVRAVRPLAAQLPFEVVVERAANETADPAALREWANAAAAGWERLAATLLFQELQRPPGAAPGDALLASLFLRSIECGLAPPDWARLPALILCRDGLRRRASIDEVTALGQRSAIRVVEPGIAAVGSVLELGVPARAALGRLRQLRFEDVTPHRQPAPWRHRMRDATDALLAVAGRVATRPPLSSAALRPAERALLAALGDERAAYFVDGRGQPQRTRRGLALPRGAADVALAARALEHEPGLAAAALALLRPLPQRE